ncbi:hypothetical protein M422DRAFT_273261 [Sphaerobolus stellatus SS14]|uniref:Uncharacterized protein n=1 Tax=Sphaerobolus stellatus (strain SS14) TaxID=990650 RepID=A0A0C9UKE9_SPHS4|nr:hypothetical protein M422DRAFT_273261 [Sphaerobolus stellatus SS14]
MTEVDADATSCFQPPPSPVLANSSPTYSTTHIVTPLYSQLYLYFSQGLRIKDNPVWKTYTTSHPRSTRYSRLNKKQLPPHSYDLVHKHIQPVSEDPNGAHQCVYAIRENSICRRPFNLKSEAKDHVAEDHFKRNAKFECCW